MGAPIRNSSKNFGQKVFLIGPPVFCSQKPYHLFSSFPGQRFFRNKNFVSVVAAFLYATFDSFFCSTGIEFFTVFAISAQIYGFFEKCGNRTGIVAGAVTDVTLFAETLVIPSIAELHHFAVRI